MHDGLPAEPAATTVQVPGVALQTSQPPAQAVLQQKPSTQLPLTHSWLRTQTEPLIFLGKQLVPLHQSRATQLASLAQVPGQTVPRPSHR